MKIQLSALKEGMNEILFEHTAGSLELQEDEEFSSIFENPIHIQINANKIGTQLFIEIIVRTIGNFACDRCLENYTKDLKDRFRLVYSLESDVDIVTGDEASDEGGLRFLTKDKTTIDISEDLRESLLLMVPMKKLCSEDCRGICPQCGANRNIEECNHRDEKIDPRWEALKKLYNSTDN